MLYGQKFTVNRPKRNTDKSKYPGKSVKVTKHFQPKLIYYNKCFQQTDFPEINSDPGTIQNDLVRSPNQIEPTRTKTPVNKFNNKCSIVNKNIPKIFQRTNCNNVSQRNILINLPTVNPSIQHNFKSKSCVVERSSLNEEIKETLKSKSAVEAGSQSTNKCVFTTDNSSFSSDKPKTPSNTPTGETLLDKIKKEIIINRIEGFRSYYTCSERKEKLLNLKKEISFLLSSPEEKKCENPADEISGQNENVLVFNVNETKNNRQRYQQKTVPKRIVNKIPKNCYEDIQQSTEEEPQSE